MHPKETITQANPERKRIDRFERAVKAKIRHFNQRDPTAILENKAWMMGSDYHPLPFAYKLLAELGAIAFARGHADANIFFSLDSHPQSSPRLAPVESITIQQALSLLARFTGDKKIDIHSLARQTHTALAEISARGQATI